MRNASAKPGNSRRHASKPSGVVSLTTLSSPRSINGNRNDAMLVLLDSPPVRTSSRRSSNAITPSIRERSSITRSQRPSHWPRYFMPAISLAALDVQNREIRGAPLFGVSFARARLSRSTSRTASTRIDVLPTPTSPTSNTFARSRISI